MDPVLSLWVRTPLLAPFAGCLTDDFSRARCPDTLGPPSGGPGGSQKGAASWGWEWGTVLRWGVACLAAGLPDNSSTWTSSGGRLA